MLPNNYELTKDNTNTFELKEYRVLQAINILLKLLSVSLISLTVLYSEYYWILVTIIFIISMIISKVAGNIAKNYKYSINGDKITISKITFNKDSKILFSDKITNCKFTKKYVGKTIITTKEPFSAILTNNKQYILFSPDRYMIGLLEELMRNK